MLFDGSVESPFVPSVLQEVKNYQANSVQQVEAKYQSLLTYLAENPTKKDAASPIRHFDVTSSPTLPELAQLFFKIDNSSYEEMEGCGPWGSLLRSHMEKNGPGGFPLPGLGCLIQLAEESPAAVSFLCIPISALVSNGLTVLSDLGNFYQQHSGLEVVQKHSLFVTLERPNQIAWLPYGLYPVPIAHLPVCEKSEKVGYWWTKTIFSKELVKRVDHPTWAAIELVNKPYLAKLSGQKVWRARLAAWDRLAADRAAANLGFDLPETLPFEDPNFDLIQSQRACERAKAKAIELKADADARYQQAVAAEAEESQEQAEQQSIPVLRPRLGRSPKSAAKPKPAPKNRASEQ